MSDDLLACPFCGGEARFGVVPYKRKFAGEDTCEVNHDHGGEFIECTNNACAASSMLIFPTMADAKPFLIEKWNRRAPKAQPAENDAGQNTIPCILRQGCIHKTMCNDAGYCTTQPAETAATQTEQKMMVDASPSQEGCAVGSAPAAATDTSPYDWPEDFADENGKYAHVCLSCGNQFIGHKRRVNTCKRCAVPAAPAAASGQTPRTNKHKVLRKYPDAYAYKWRDGWAIYAGKTGVQNGLRLTKHSPHVTAAQAWADAARRLK